MPRSGFHGIIRRATTMETFAVMPGFNFRSALLTSFDRVVGDDVLHGQWRVADPAPTLPWNVR